MEYKDKAFEEIDKYCPAAAKIKLGNIIDTLYDSIINNSSFEGNALTDEELESLDKMCVGSDITDVAYILNNIIQATKGEVGVEGIDDEVVDKLDNGICGTLQVCQLGSKLKEMILKVNGGTMPASIAIDLPAEEETLGGKTVKDLQKNIEIKNNNITGELLYVTDYTELFSGEEKDGHFLALYFEDATDSNNTVEIQVSGKSKKTKLDTDGLFVCRITEEGKKPLIVTITKQDGTTGKKILTVADLVLA